MSIVFCIIFWVSMFSVPSFAAFGVGSLQEQKQKVRTYLLKRKRGFDAFQKKKEEFRRQRLARANEIKAIRKAREEKKEKARRSFRRTNEAFPIQEYKAFLKEREIRRVKLKKAQADHVAIQKELQKVFEDKKYKINGKKEYDL